MSLKCAQKAKRNTKLNSYLNYTQYP